MQTKSYALASNSGAQVLLVPSSWPAALTNRPAEKPNRNPEKKAPAALAPAQQPGRLSPRPTAPANLPARPQAVPDRIRSLKILSETSSHLPMPRSKTPTPELNNQHAISAMPMLGIESVGPAEINVGKTAAFTITIKNLSDTGLQGVVVQVTVPATAEFRSAEPSPEVVHNQLKFVIGALAAKGERHIKLNIVPRKPGGIDLVTQATFSASVQSPLQVRQPQLSVKFFGPSESLYGEVVTFRAVITNAGDGPAEDVTVNHLLPKNVTDTGIRQVQAVLKELPAKIGWLMPGQSEEINLTAVADHAGLMRAEIAVVAGELETKSSAEFRVRRPMIEVKADGPDVRYVQRSGSYSIMVMNPGDAAAENITVEATVPAGLQITAADQNTNYDKNLSTLSWSLAKIEPGSTAVFKFQAMAIEEGDQVQQVVATADRGLVVGTTHATRVFGKPHIVMTVTDSDGPIEVGGSVDYEVQITNRGTKSAQKVIVKAILPHGLEPTKSHQYGVQGNTVTFSTMDELAAGESCVLRFQAVGHKAGDHVVRVTLESDATAREAIEKSTSFYSN